MGLDLESGRVNSGARSPIGKIFFRASVLIAGWNEAKSAPLLLRAVRVRKVNPKNVNAVCS